MIEGKASDATPQDRTRRHGVDASEQPVLRKRLGRKQMLGFFAELPPTVIGMEACGSSHYWARELKQLGHEVKLIAPQHVKPTLRATRTTGGTPRGCARR